MTGLGVVVRTGAPRLNAGSFIRRELESTAHAPCLAMACSVLSWKATRPPPEEAAGPYHSGTSLSFSKLGCLGHFVTVTKSGTRRKLGPTCPHWA